MESEEESEEESDESEPTCFACIEDNEPFPNVASRECEKYDQEGEDNWPVIPGQICRTCCEGEFQRDSAGCFSVCYDKNAIPENVVRFFEQTFDIEGLTASDFHGSKSFLSEERTYLVSPDLTGAVEHFKPVPIEDFLDDSLNDVLYVKRRDWDMASYSLHLYHEAEHRLKAVSWSGVTPDMLSTEDGLLFLVWDYPPVKLGAVIAPQVSGLVQPTSIVEELQKKAEESRRFFGVTGPPNSLISHDQLASRFDALDEDNLIDRVAIPLLRDLGFLNVKRTPSHGPGEEGLDIGPFYEQNKLGFVEFSGAQTKARKIHGKARTSQRNVNEVINQLEAGFRKRFNFEGKEERVSTMYAIFSKEVTPEAQSQLDSAVRELRDKGKTVHIIGSARLLEMLVEHNISLG